MKPHHAYLQVVWPARTADRMLGCCVTTGFPLPEAFFFPFLPPLVTWLRTRVAISVLGQNLLFFLEGTAETEGLLRALVPIAAQLISNGHKRVEPQLSQGNAQRVPTACLLPPVTAPAGNSLLLLWAWGLRGNHIALRTLQQMPCGRAGGSSRLSPAVSSSTPDMNLARNPGFKQGQSIVLLHPLQHECIEEVAKAARLGRLAFLIERQKKIVHRLSKLI